MLAGGLDPSEEPAEAARRVVQAGLHFFEVLREINEECGVSLSLRAGIHTGPVIGGVIGTKRLAYDIWGSTVNIASRMESQGVAGCLQLSAQTQALVGRNFPTKPRGAVDIKGLGPVETWLLDGAGTAEKEAIETT